MTTTCGSVSATVGGADHGQADRRADLGVYPPPRLAYRCGYLLRPDRPAEVLGGPGRDRAVGVDDLGGDGLGGDAHGQGADDAAGQRVVGAGPAPAGATAKTSSTVRPEAAIRARSAALTCRMADGEGLAGGHPAHVDAVTGIPDVRAGDSAWWHCDMVHSVAPVHNQQGWGTVMYIPAAPWCPRNERYAVAVREAFLTGSSPRDFPDENYERDWPRRFGPGDLNETGRRGLGLA